MKKRSDFTEITSFVCVPGMAHISEVETHLQPRAVTPKA